MSEKNSTTSSQVDAIVRYKFMKKHALNKFIKLFNILLEQYENILRKYLLETSIEDFDADEKSLNREINKFIKKRDFLLRLLK
ncbi:MAG: hypothetical protein GY804_15430 [Alphaproteobacteria bacterium]|nr:hypothetical protein [Alphaproteobacteria bacterium]